MTPDDDERPQAFLLGFLLGVNATFALLAILHHLILGVGVP